MTAPGTMGMTPWGMAKPCPCSRKKRMTPSAAARPKALPPASSRPCTVSTWASGRMSSVSRQPGAKPGTAMPGVKPCGQRMAVQPVWFRSSVAWPASRPSMAVRVVLVMGAPVSAGAAVPVRPCVGGRGTNLACSRGKGKPPAGGAFPAGRPALVPGRAGEGKPRPVGRAPDAARGRSAVMQRQATGRSVLKGKATGAMLPPSVGA